MKSKIVMMASAGLLVGGGLLLNFLPQEAAAALGMGSVPVAALPLQVLSGALLGMGFLNWLSRDKPMGGIYSRPLALQNFVLFGVGAIALDRAALRGSMPPLVQLTAVAFTVFAGAFGWLMFFHDPVADAQKNPQA
jgi:hypothetical protein